MPCRPQDTDLEFKSQLNSSEKLLVRKKIQFDIFLKLSFNASEDLQLNLHKERRGREEGEAEQQWDRPDNEWGMCS